MSAAALSLMLALPGTGLGFSRLSPHEDHSAVVTGLSAKLWISLTSIVASGIGGQMAGRLRVKWATVHNDEVFFRDTAHGLLAWAVATVLTAAMFCSALTSAISGAAKNSDMGANLNPGEYYTDMLMRSDEPLAESNGNPRAEAACIFSTSVANGSLAADDRTYLAQTVAAGTGMAPADAEKWFDEVYARMSAAVTEARAVVKDAADKARLRSRHH